MLFANWLINISQAMAVEGSDPLKPWAGPDFPFWQYSLKVLAVLSAIVGVLFLVLALWKRLAPRYQRHPALIRVLATHYLTPKQALILVAVGQETFLLASSASNLSVIPVNKPVSERGLEPLPPPQS
jgi:flagellar biogenesis protein FliO|uniref:Flagellar protein n=1 Tax=Desulfobacca acetoxidans TaxID=60893 RepID=A0A7C3Z0I0_9BACT